MSNSISRRTFLKCTGASVAALGAASLLGGCQQNGSATIVDVKVGDKVSNWNGLGVQLTSLFNIDTAPAQARPREATAAWPNSTPARRSQMPSRPPAHRRCPPPV